MGLLLRLASHWIAGEFGREAIDWTKRVNGQKISGIINYLGELYTNEPDISRSVEEYLGLLRTLAQEGIDGTISVKLTQLGLCLNDESCRGNLGKILEEAKATNKLVWVDMEGSRFTEQTLQICREMNDRYRNVGVAIQANLRRSEADLETLLRDSVRIRLVKGAYAESAEIAYKNKSEISANYSKLSETMFRSGEAFALGTHDDKLIEQALELKKRYDRDVEFQMLKGIRDPLKLGLVRRGLRVAEYIPYGPEWLRYSVRRIREKKSNILLIIRSLLP